MDCGALRQAFAQGRPLTAAEQAHVDGCEACLDAWLDSTVTEALNEKPEVGIPADFAARVAAGLPEKRVSARGTPNRMRHWGLIAAVIVAAVVLVAIAVANPVKVNTWIGMGLLVLVVSEVAGIALWLGARTGD
jgi:hypothetical protein